MIKALLKKSRVLYEMNAQIKSRQTKNAYELMCREYDTPSVLREPGKISEIAIQGWKELNGGKFEVTKNHRILFLGADYHQDHSGTIQALQKFGELTIFLREDKYGQAWPKTKADIEECRRVNGNTLSAYIDRAAAEGKPYDVIIGQMWGLTMDEHTLGDARSKGIAIVNIAMDDRHAFNGFKLQNGSYTGTKALAPFLSMACTDVPESIYWYRQLSCSSIFFPEASDPDFFTCPTTEKKYDVSFVGANYGIRTKIVHALTDAGVKVETYGNGWPKGRINNDTLPALFAESKIILGCGTILHCDDFYTLKLRDFDAPTSGSFYLTHFNADFSPLFTAGKEIETYGDLKEVVEKARYYLSNDSERESIAANGKNKALAFHTWEKRFSQLFSHLQFN